MPDGFPRGRPAHLCPGTPAMTVCSAKGCHETATWVLAWNNPKIHTPDRRKQWTACGAHRESLAAFLGARGFLRDVSPLEE